MTRIITRTLTAAALLAATSCSSTVRTGNSPVFLVIDSLQGIRGAATAGQPSATLFSDVITVVTTGGSCTTTSPCPTVFSDAGQAVMELAKKDVTATTAPTTNNQVTLNRIHVHYRLPSGGGVPGVDVPADFDTFSTATVPASGTATIGFELVQVQAKLVPPLYALRFGGLPIAATADVTFFGTDQVGNAISVMGSIQIEFANWGD
jgi:hypothetical protein